MLSSSDGVKANRMDGFHRFHTLIGTLYFGQTKEQYGIGKYISVGQGDNVTDTVELARHKISLPRLCPISHTAVQ